MLISCYLCTIINVEMKLAVLKGFKNKSVTISCLPFVVGRCRSADFIIAHVNVSRNHCEIVKENGSWKIKDYSSSGTYLNNKLVGKGKSVLLNNGDSIRLGPVETNLDWTFYSFDSLSKNSNNSDVMLYSQMLFDLSKEKCSVADNCHDQEVHFSKFFEDNKSNEGSIDSTFIKKKGEVKSKEVSQKEELSYSSREGNYKDKSEGQKIQELTKELQQVQNALNDLEEKNCVLQEELAAGAINKTESTVATNLLNNLTDLMETEFQCTICSELFVTAVTLSCTHMFCKYCINQWKKKQKTCPICRKKIITETRSLVVDNYIDKMVGNLSLELKKRREAVIKERERENIEPCKKRSRTKIKTS